MLSYLVPSGEETSNHTLPGFGAFPVDSGLAHYDESDVEMGLSMEVV